TVTGTHTYAAAATGTHYSTTVTVHHETANDLIISGFNNATITNLVWVNDDWRITNDIGPAGLSYGDTVAPPGGETAPNSTGIPLIFGVDAFDTIQTGINGDASGGTVYVLPGTFSE